MNPRSPVVSSGSNTKFIKKRSAPMLLVKNAPKRRVSPMVGPWAYFLDAKIHKPPTFSRKISGLRFFNLAVKERFESSSPHVSTVFNSAPKQLLLLADFCR
jgi:hypothetical protein